MCRECQGLLEKVEDPQVLREVARIVRAYVSEQSREEGSADVTSQPTGPEDT